jgi:hypothetical protein
MIAYKTFADCPDDQKPFGIPNVWPWQMASIEEAQADEYGSNGWTVLSSEGYEAYLAAHQAEFDAWHGISQVPRIITARQIRLAMVGGGISLDQISAMLENLDEPMRSIATISWEYASEFYRDDPLLVAMAPMLGLSDEQIDQLFNEGAKI